VPLIRYDVTDWKPIEDQAAARCSDEQDAAQNAAADSVDRAMIFRSYTSPPKD
jgi:hypothetical protein